ncbi:cilia- and flagella-associated protein 161 isoform X2 [Galleria mellonella]|uniref:Cilia- and flagella-associated protein 161 isoform X2 n=1 Tax=Galleria mellonella TaxID=7137 RepID=A0A6J3C8S2_GALME|nr:cilia- and flagella-associated protein 161 isoform X2 [Galleria mellonella]
MSYNNSVLIGNWSEERLKNEAEFKLFLRKRDRRELVLQRSRTLFSNLLKERPLAISGTFVLFGFNVQLVASDMPAKFKSETDKTQYGLALSSLVSERQVDYMQNINDGCLMTLSPITTPCCRNTFVILSTENESIHGEKMNFGDEFLLRAENYGDPDTGAKVIVKNCVTDKCLCVMNQNWMQTFFGPECGVTCRNYIDIHKRYTAENIFTLVSDVETKTKQ